MLVQLKTKNINPIIMTEHIVFPKIRHLDAEETFWILDFPCFVQEKLDGANLSVWLHEWEMYVGSRTQIVWDATRKEWFRWAVEYCNNHKGIRGLLEHLWEDFRLYWEWLVQHSLTYPKECYQKFYMFDIYDKVHDNFYTPDTVDRLAKEYWIEHPEILLQGNITIEQIQEVAGTSKIAKIGEWVVIKAPEFTNKFLQKQYAKYVTSDFKEVNKLSFWCSARHDMELNFATTFVTIPRLLKLINKIEQLKDETIARPHIPILIWMMWHDVFTEELWWYIKKHHSPSIDFKKMEKYCVDRTKILFLDWLQNWILTNHQTDA